MLIHTKTGIIFFGMILGIYGSELGSPRQQSDLPRYYTMTAYMLYANVHDFMNELIEQGWNPYTSHRCVEECGNVLQWSQNELLSALMDAYENFLDYQSFYPTDDRFIQTSLTFIDVIEQFNTPNLAIPHIRHSRWRCGLVKINAILKCQFDFE